jgi:signal transduction histidine kinase
MLSRRLVEIQEGERRHIARELHDEIGQALTGLHLLLEMMNRATTLAQVQSKLGDARQLVYDLMTQVREMSLDLRPAMLDDLGLLPTLRWYFNRYTTQTGIPVIFKHTAMEQRFAPEIETVVYRLIQEALTNVARYAQVEEVTVRIWKDPQTLGMHIEDTGIGFDPEAALATNASSGLAGMHERVGLLGGTLEIESSPGQGTCIVIDLPLLAELDKQEQEGKID